MAVGDRLPDGDRIARGCSKGYDNGEVTASAFSLRQIDLKFNRISVDWVECPYADESEQNLDGSASRSKTRPVVRGPYAVLGVSEIRQVSRGRWVLDVEEVGGRKGPCHSGISGFSGAEIDLELQGDLADIANKSPVFY